jgi:hypothetical protein
MKTKNIFFVLTSIFIFANCFAQNENSVPCQDKGISDAQFFRVNCVARHKDMDKSKEQSLLTAKKKIASEIDSIMKIVLENYTSQFNEAKAKDVKTSFKKLMPDFEKQQLKFLKVDCQKTDKNKDGKFETYTALEVSKDEYLRNLSSKIMANKSLKEDYDESKFRELITKENK